MILTRAQIAAFEKAIAVANHALHKLDMLHKLGKVNPLLEARVDEIRKKRDYLYALAEAALEFNNQLATTNRP